MLKLFVLIICFVASGCSTLNIPKDFKYKEIQTRDFTLASWQKINQPDGVYKFYIEGDGNAFNRLGKPTSDPTPKASTLRQLAFEDSSPNVIYLARPCQFIKSPICSKRHWTTARFAPEIVNSEHSAIKQISGNNEVILIGYSGGAQIAGLVSAAKPGLNVKKLVTIAGNLTPLAWTTYHNLPPVNESLSLENYRQQYLEIPQIHYVGSQDKVIPPLLIKNFIDNKWPIITVEEASHGEGWEKIYPSIWAEH